MLTNPMETRLVSSLGIKVGGREVPAQPLELVRSSLAQGRDDAFDDDPADDEAGEPRAGPAAGPGMTEPTPADSSAGDGDVRPDASRPAVPAGPIWSDAAVRRLAQVPSFVRGMVKRIYTDYARENGIAEITPAVMDRARTDLGLEGM
ncbi:MAG: hypothetical protein GWM90_25525 [Gemmatimonadetes bacterium]|nr:hypothetical protein [Gemmatimonadota bacterium]NIQ58180.1 hypothetical protein [Gemmatimonadota bacterium]NIU78386.1 hypothetical protein [Gammaproteobacteria bacterium]NIX47316.1 hypothetical protein [Gemmatimonadota bacterium]NIY11691.1 hypothetical protein [Gemmatimonadota bacterium]